jgi:hypothetical protein
MASQNHRCLCDPLPGHVLSLHYVFLRLETDALAFYYTIHQRVNNGGFESLTSLRLYRSKPTSSTQRNGPSAESESINDSINMA